MPSIPFHLALILSATLAPARSDEAPAPDVDRTLDRMRAAYTSASTLTDDFTITLAMPGQEPEVQLGHVRCDKVGGFDVRSVGVPLTITACDGTLTFQHPDVHDKAVAVDLGDNALDTLHSSLTTMASLIPPQLVLRLGGAPDALVPSLSMGLLDEAHPTSVRHVGDAHVVTFEQAEGSGKMTLSLDAESSLIVSCRSEAEPPGAPAGVTVSVELRCAPIVDVESTDVVAVPGDLTLLPDLADLLRLTNRAQAATPSVAIGQPAPPFELIDQDGVSRSLSDYRGEIVVLDFWGTWCRPCVASMPALQAMHDEHSDRDVTLLALNVRDENETMATFCDANAISFACLNDAEDVAAAYGIKSYPSAVLIDEHGVVVFASTGAAHHLTRMVDELLE